MRIVLKNGQEACHFWANQTQNEGRSGNIFFEGGAIFSYGRHFAIAKHYNDKGLILFTNESYSVPTSKHISYTRQAIPHGADILYCHNPAWPADPENLRHAIYDIEYNLKKAIKARERKLDYMNTAENAYNSLVRLKTVFKLKDFKIPTYDFSIPESVLQTIAAREEKAKARQKRAEAKQRKQDRLDFPEFLEDVKAWKAGALSAHEIRHSKFKYNEKSGDYCRINGEVVETLRSADAPLKEVKAVLRRLSHGKSIKGLKLGHYTVTSYSEEVLTVGCHTFKAPEINWLMAELNI